MPMIEVACFRNKIESKKKAEQRHLLAKADKFADKLEIQCHVRNFSGREVEKS